MRVFTVALACSILTAACGGKTAAPPPVPPAAPAGLAATGGNGQIALTWTAVSGATSYLILRGEAAGAEAALTPPATATAAAYTDTGLTAAKTYYYVVEAKNSAGTSAKSNEASATTTPSPPTGLIATGGVGQVALSWTAVAGATGYSLSRGLAAGGPYAEIATPSGTSYTDSAVASGTAYYYVVQGVTAQGKTDKSTEAPALTAPDAPTGVTATPASTHVNLSWTASVGASNYDVLRASGGSGFAVVGSTSSTAFTDAAGILPGTAYSYVVRASNVSGTSANSNPAQNVTTGPPAPTGVTLASGNAKVALSWTASPGASGYDVLRSTTSGSGYTSVGKPSGTSFTDTTVTNGATYYYIVRATSAAGSSDDAGPFTGTPHRELCVADSARSVISVFNAELTGNVAPLRSYGSLTGMAAPNSIAFDDVDGEYFVANTVVNTITTYSNLASGNAAPKRTLSGVLGRMAYDVQTDQIFVVAGNTVKAYGRTASGNAAPQQTLTLPAGANAQAIAIQDPAKGSKMFVMDPHKIYVYSKTDTGTTAPSATIISTSIGSLLSIAYDATADEILVGNDVSFVASVLAFPSSSPSGGTTPSRTLGGNLTLLQRVSDLAVDTTNNILYVVDITLGAVLAFPRTFSGNANIAPSWTLFGSATQIAAQFSGKMAADVLKGEILVLNTDGRLLVFKLADANNTPPQRSISGVVTGIEVPNGLRYDPLHKEIIVANNGQNPSVTAHPQLATGNALPLRTLGGLTSGIQDVEIDLTHDEMFVAQLASAGDSINVYARTATGSAPPLRSITGSNTALSSPSYLAYDAQSDAIVVSQGQRIDTYARAFSIGNEAPLTTIRGSNTNLVSGEGMFVDAVNGEIAIQDPSGLSPHAGFFARTANGNVAPLQTFQTLSGPFIYIDNSAGEVFSAGYAGVAPTIAVYPRFATGAPTPVRQINGTATGLISVTGMAVCN